MNLGHVHLKVSDLEEAVQFYRDIFDFEIEEEMGRYVFLRLGEEHHSLALQEVKGSRRSTRDRPGLYHVAFEVDNEERLREIHSRVQEKTRAISPVDHGISRSIYFHDPSGNGLEVYVDTRARTGKTRWDGENEQLSFTDS